MAYSANINLFNLLTGEDSGGNWTQAPTNPEVVDISNPSSVSFSGVNTGNYVFTYSGGSAGCADSESVTVTVTESVASGYTSALTRCVTSGTTTIPFGYNLYNSSNGATYSGTFPVSIELVNTATNTTLTSASSATASGSLTVPVSSLGLTTTGTTVLNLKYKTTAPNTCNKDNAFTVTFGPLMGTPVTTNYSACGTATINFNTYISPANSGTNFTTFVSYVSGTLYPPFAAGNLIHPLSALTAVTITSGTSATYQVWTEYDNGTVYCSSTSAGFTASSTGSTFNAGTGSSTQICN